MATCVIAPVGPAGPAPASAQPRPHATTATATTPADQAAWASAQAKKTGKPVTVPGSTTAITTTTATPRGTFVLTQTLQPTRVRRGKSWVGLDARLHRNPDGSVSPNATTSGLMISGGGTAPLATMTEGGVRLSFTWPTRLPNPAISGASATYANVLAGVDLVVTATPQGGFSHVLVVKNKTAAADPALKTLVLRAHGDGLTVTADTHGYLTAGIGAHARPIFAAKPATMWDSATRVVKPTATGPDLPQAPGVREPGRHAHTAAMKTTVTHPRTLRAEATRGRAPGGTDATITLAPDTGLLSAKSTVFPVYIDPTWNPLPAGGSRQAWASVSSALDAIEYDNSYDPNANVLQVGYVNGFKARSFMRFGVSSVLKDATIYSSDVKFTVDNDGDEFCHTSTSTDLWWTGGISKSISWSNQPSWTSKIDSASADNCPNHSVDFNTTSFMQDHGTSGASSMTFGLRAPDETTDTEWEEFYGGNGEATMSTEYDHAPNLGRIPSTSPGGLCQTGDPSSMVIGKDDITFSVVPSDPDGSQLLGTEFVILDYGTSNIVFDSGNPDTTPGITSGTPARLTITRPAIERWHPEDGINTPKAHDYSWYVVTSDGKLHSPSSGLGTSGSRCHFTYDPNGPAVQPGLQDPTGTLTLGQQATATVAPCADALASPPVACTGTAPTRYVYQVNETAPISVTATGSPQTLSIPLHHVGPNLLTVYGLSAGGNPGPVASKVFIVDGPATPYTDGDINGDGNPDFLTDSTGNTGLWLGTTDGKGGVATPTNIGALGTGVSDIPADWNGAQILRGDFSGDHVQDIIAYYPTGNSAGNAMLLYGNGDTSPLSPSVGTQQKISAPNLNNTNSDNPSQLVAAGNADLQGHELPDLIGIAGDTPGPTGNYELDLYNNNGVFAAYGEGNDFLPLAGANQTPDGSGWENYALATAQPGGQTVLFALNTATGKLYESTNPGQNPSTPIGSPGTWTPALTVPWTSAPKLVSADVNAAGQIELWTEAGLSATAYTLAGTTVSQEATTNLLAPTHHWPLTDGNNAPSGADTSDGTTPATLSSTGATWTTDGFLDRPVISLDGKSSGYLTLPDGLVQASTSLAVTLSFRAQPGTNGILFSTGHDVPSALNSSAMPVMYIGTDERLYAQFWNGYVRPMTSPERVDDDQWHTVTLTADGYDQSLFLDDDLRIGMAGSPALSNGDPKNYVGAGVFPANTSSKKWVNAPGTATTTRASYFTGKIANVVYYNQFLTPPQVAPYNSPKAITGAITSDLSGGLCIDNKGGSTTDGNPIQIWTCNGGAAQQWTITPDNSNDDLNNTIVDGKCLAVSGGNTANSTPIILWKCIPTDPAQKWHLESDGQLWNPNSGKCLADPGSSTTPGTQLIIYDCDYASEQNWHTP